MIYEGYEELENMNKKQLLSLVKDTIKPTRIRGGIESWTETETVQRTDIYGNLYPYELTSHYCKKIPGTNMSEHRFVLGEDEYTWTELKKYPVDILRLMIYQYLRENQEEE